MAEKRNIIFFSQPFPPPINLIVPEAGIKRLNLIDASNGESSIEMSSQPLTIEKHKNYIFEYANIIKANKEHNNGK